MMKIIGIVIRGKQIGRKLGFPTANIKVENKLNSGVYSGEVIINTENYKAAIFVPLSGECIEAHILDFDDDIYGEEIEILIGKKIREVNKFKNNLELKEQIKKDLELIRE